MMRCRAPRAETRSGWRRSAENPASTGGPDSSKNKKNEYHVRPAYEKALARWQDVSPDVRCTSYLNITDDDIAALGDDVIVVLDTPYEGSQAAYDGNGFDYDAYWDRVKALSGKFYTILFDRQANIEGHGYETFATRKMRVNGARLGDAEAMSFTWSVEHLAA
jgi:hypothetical protein